MNGISLGELVKQAKGEDRSLREYARDSGVDAAIISKMINGTYIPNRPGIFEALTSQQASPRGDVTSEQLMVAAGASKDFQSGMSVGMSAGMLASLDDIPSSTMVRALQARGITVDSRGLPESINPTMKPEEVRRIQRLQTEMQRFAATANGIILGGLGRKGVTFQIIHTNGAEVDGIHFDTSVRLMNHEISEYLIRYAFLSEEGASLPLARNTARRMVEELVFLKPARDRMVSVVTNHPGAYDDLCACKNQLSYNGELSVFLFDLERAAILRQDYLSHCITENPVDEILLT